MSLPPVPPANRANPNGDTDTRCPGDDEMTISNNDLLALTRELPIPVPWNRDAFIDNLACRRGRPIRLLATDARYLAGSPCGVWLKRDTDDVILHEIGTSEYHIDQIVCHEIGHMVLQHDIGSRSASSEHSRYVNLCRAVMPDLDPTSVRAVLGRIDYASDQERDAEMFASLLMIAAADAGAQASIMRSVFFRRQ
jgi:hypothetical protein